jgi:hypothetical protein
VTADLGTLLTALYVPIGDHVIPSAQQRPGRPKKLSDAGLVCLAVAQVRPGLTLIGARGSPAGTSRTWSPTGAGLHMIRPDRRGEAPRHGSIGWVRQWIESVNDTLKGQLDLERHGSRTTEGVYARVAQRLAMAAVIWRNWATAESGKRSLIAYGN